VYETLGRNFFKKTNLPKRECPKTYIHADN
jgi:hypothetical protein